VSRASCPQIAHFSKRAPSLGTPHAITAAATRFARPPRPTSRTSVEKGDHAVFLAGESSYTQELMLRGIVDGPSPDDAVARLTHERIRALAAQLPTVYLVAHDPETAARLAERRVVRAIPEKVAA
jgi:hypothetical protein